MVVVNKVFCFQRSMVVNVIRCSMLSEEHGGRCNKVFCFQRSMVVVVIRCSAFRGAWWAL